MPLFTWLVFILCVIDHNHIFFFLLSLYPSFYIPLFSCINWIRTCNQSTHVHLIFLFVQYFQRGIAPPNKISLWKPPLLKSTILQKKQTPKIIAVTIFVSLFMVLCFHADIIRWQPKRIMQFDEKTKDSLGWLALMVGN